MFGICVVALLLTELFGLINSTHAPHYFLSVDPNSHSPFFAYAVASMFAVHVQFHGRQGHVAAAFATGAILTALHAALFYRAGREWPIIAGTFCYYLGIGSGLMLAWLSWRGRGTVTGRAFAASLKLGLLLPLSVAISWSWLEAISLARPNTFDGVLYRFEDSLGFQASATAAVLFQRWPPLSVAAELIYAALPLFAAIEYGLQCRQDKSPATILKVFLLIALAGFAIYFLYPAIGPKYLLGDLFPARMPDVAQMAMAMAPAPRAYRNAMPSLHMAWAMALWFGARELSPLARSGFALVALGTALATLGLGEHYLIDLVVALPFALAAHAACVPGRPPAARHAAIVGAALTVIWLVYLSTGATFFACVGRLHLLAIAVTLASTFGLWHRLAARQ